MLESNYRTYDFLQSKVVTIDLEIEQALQQYAALNNDGVLPVVNNHASSKQKRNKNTPAFNIKQYLRAILATDVLEIYELGEIGV